ncbi:MAG TPA: ABC transporter permease subunit [Candidatus Limiplasma sp.]|nr:ABC transporter permease subunit [Candidatus Limiplasma sp.]
MFRWASGHAGGYLSRQRREWNQALKRDYELYLLLIPVIAFFVVFSYMPMYGLQIAFKDYTPAISMEAAPWVGLKHLERFLHSFYFDRVIRNTLVMSLYNLAIMIPAPILLALLFNEVRRKQARVTLQVVSYAPYFVSTVVLASMVVMFLTPGTGFINTILQWLGYARDTSILSVPSAFKHIYVWSEAWKNIGWDSIIYTAAIAGVPQELYEVARLDGASKLKQIRYVTLPCIAPTITILAIMAIGGVLNVGYEKVFLLQNTSNLEASEVISTYVYKSGLEQAQYSFASMVGLFNNVINFAILVLANQLSHRIGETSLW